jgi:hypothetical protein
MFNPRFARPVVAHSTSRAALTAFTAASLSCWTLNVTAQQAQQAQRTQQPQQFELEWESPSGCPQKSKVDERIHLLLGASPGSVLSSHLRALGVVEPIGERFQLTLTVDVGQTRKVRVIASDECTSLGEAAAVVLGLLVRKELDLGRELSNTDLGNDFQTPSKPIEPTAEKSVSPAEKKASPAPKSPVIPAQVPEPEPEPGFRRQWFLLVRGPMGSADFLTLPDTGLGLGLAAGVLHYPWRFFASATFWSSQERTTTGAEAYRATFKRQSAEIWGCRGWRKSTFELAPCVVTAVDLLNAGASSGRLTTQERRVGVFSAGVGLTGHLHLASWLSLFLSTTGRFIVNRPTFVVQAMSITQTDPVALTSEQAHTVPTATIVSSLGVEWIF